MAREVQRAAPAAWAAGAACFSAYGFCRTPLPVIAAGLVLGAISITAGFSPLSGRSPIRAATLSRLAAGAALGLVIGAAVSLAVSARAPPVELSLFRIDELEGRAAADATLTASGNLSVPFDLERAVLKGEGFSLDLRWPVHRPRIRIISSPGPLVLKGDRAIAGVTQALRPSVEGGAIEFFYARELRLSDRPTAADRARRSIRSALADRIRRVSGKAYPLAQALILGITDSLEDSEEKAFRDAGCAHVLSLSGQHLSILCLMVSLVASRLFRRPRAAEILSPLLAVAFTWLAGSGPALVRAASMMTLSMAAGKLDRPMRGLTSLALALCLGMAADPLQTKSVSFILSYAAMAGLILFSRPWEDLLWRLPAPLPKALAPSLAAICATAPISASFFGIVALGGLFAATLSGPVILVFMWSLIGTSLLGAPFPVFDPLLARWHEAIHAVILLIMKAGSLVPAIRVENSPDLLILSLAVVALLGFVYASPYVEYALFRMRYLRPAGGLRIDEAPRTKRARGSVSG